MTNLVAEANVATGEFIHRPMTETEIEADELNRAQVAAQNEIELQAKTEAAAAKSALLNRLSITEAEAQLLLS